MIFLCSALTQNVSYYVMSSDDVVCQNALCQIIFILLLLWWRFLRESFWRTWKITQLFIVAAYKNSIKFCDNHLDTMWDNLWCTVRQTAKKFYLLFRNPLPYNPCVIYALFCQSVLTQSDVIFSLAELYDSIRNWRGITSLLFLVVWHSIKHKNF